VMSWWGQSKAYASALDPSMPAQLSRGHYTKRQKSYAKASLRKPIANEKANAIGFCNPKMLVFGSARPTCTNDPLRNVPKGCLIATACVLR
jgi:hypothetical protein